MKKLIQLFIAITLISGSTWTFAGNNNFQFQISEYHTKRQAGQVLDVYVRYAMKDEVKYSQYPDYRELRKIAMKYLEPTADLPINTYWEIIAAKMSEELMASYPLSGVSIQMLVYPNEKGTIYEPGFHGPIFTVGDAIPFNNVVTPSAGIKK